MANSHATKLIRTSSQYWSITDASQTGLDITGDMTIEFWLKLEQLPSTLSQVFHIASKWNVVGDRSYRVYIAANDSISGEYADSSDARSRINIPFFVANDVGKWIHFAVVFDVSVPLITIYHNGLPLSGTMSFTDATSIKDTTLDFAIGAKSSGTLPFDGQIDEVRVWNDVRTADEISGNMWRELTGSEANLQGYWKFNNDGLDETSNNNDLTNNNSATFGTETPFLHDYNGTLALGRN